MEASRLALVFAGAVTLGAVGACAGDGDETIPPRVYLQPGEIGCDAHAAANGEAQRPPH